MGALTFVILSVLPGGWVTFGAPLCGFGFWSRLLTGVALTPPVLCSEFYALRLAGVSFESSAALLPWLNLPAVLLIARRFDRSCLPNSKMLLGAGLVLFTPLGLLFAQWTQPEGRAYSWHAWMHSDVVSMIANGHLMVGEPEMAGVRLAYPWLGHAYQAVLSYQLHSPPAWNFVWVNLVWLLTIYGLAALLVGELGGGPLFESDVGNLAFFWRQHRRVRLAKAPSSCGGVATLGRPPLHAVARKTLRV